MTTGVLSTFLAEELKASITGNMYLPDDPQFAEYSTVFNGDVKTSSKAVVRPLNAEDVRQVLLFCSKYSLYPSIKAGGYGTAGWAIKGDIIVDLGKLGGIDIEPPQSGDSFTSLRDMPSFGENGKGSAGALVADQSVQTSGKGKRKRDEYEELRSYDAASKTVAKFLRGPPLPNDIDEPPSARFRIDDEVNISSPRDLSSDLDSDIGPFALSPRSTVATSPSPPQDTHGHIFEYGSMRPDPFGYLTNDSGPSASLLPSTSMQSALDCHSIGNYLRIPLSESSVPLVPLTETEPLYPHAYVTFGAGIMQKEVDIFTAQHPLQAKPSSGNVEIPYHVPFSAHPVGSSVMLLGGFGFLSRLYGLSIDNLIEVEMVLADGRIIIVNREEYPDIWWALRGAGPCIGVATRYKARAYPVPVVFAGNLIYRFRRATAPSLIKHFRDCVKGAPRELYANVLLTAGPAGKDSLVVIQICYVGTKEKGREYLAAISAWDGEACLLNEVDEKSFLHQQDSVAQVLRGKAGNQWFIRSVLINSLPDDVVNKTVIEFADSPHGCTWLFELAGGAITDFEDTCIPKVNRAASFTIAALHQWPMGVDDPRCVESAEDWIIGTLGPVSVGSPFPSFLGRSESPTRTMSCFGDNWTKLCEIKKQYDPNGLFRNTFWPLGVNGEVLEPSAHGVNRE